MDSPISPIVDNLLMEKFQIKKIRAARLHTSTKFTALAHKAQVVYSTLELLRRETSVVSVPKVKVPNVGMKYDGYEEQEKQREDIW